MNEKEMKWKYDNNMADIGYFHTSFKESNFEYMWLYFS